MSSRPRIVIAVAEDVIEGRWDDYSSDYACAVESAGGEAIPAYYGRSALGPTPYDGIVLMGGDDVDPGCYGEPRDERVDPRCPQGTWPKSRLLAWRSPTTVRCLRSAAARRC